MSLANAPADVIAAYHALSGRQQLYVDGMLAGKFHDVAMREAGYAPSTSRAKAGQVAKRPNVAKVLAWHASVALAKQAVTVDRVVEEMGDIALFDPLSIYDMDGKVLPVNLWPESARRAFAGWDSNGLPKFVSKTDAAEKLARMKGWYAQDSSPKAAVFGVIVVPQKGSIDLDKATGIIDMDADGTLRIHAV